MRAIDTNVLLRLMIAGDPAQTDLAEQFVRPGVWVSTVALVEAVWVLNKTYQMSARRQSEVVQLLIDNPSVALEHPEAVRGALHLFRARPALRSEERRVGKECRS